MPYSKRLLENGQPRTLESGGMRDLEVIPPAGATVSWVWPKTAYSWTDRTGIYQPDYPVSLKLSGITPLPAADAGALVITADSNTPQAILALTLVLWDERGNPISASSGSITTSSVVTNAAGNYIAANGLSLGPAYQPINVAAAAGYSVHVARITPAANTYGTAGSITLATSTGSAIVTGTGTSFVTSMSVGMWLIFSADTTDTLYQIASIQSNTQVTLTRPVAAAAAGSGQTALACTTLFNLHSRLF